MMDSQHAAAAMMQARPPGNPDTTIPMQHTLNIMDTCSEGKHENKSIIFLQKYGKNARAGMKSIWLRISIILTIFLILDILIFQGISISN